MKRSKILFLLMLPLFLFALPFTDGKKVQVYTTAENTTNKISAAYFNIDFLNIYK